MNESKVDIVLVEDNPNDAELTIRSLKKRRLGNNILHLKDGAEALELFFGEEGPSPRGPDGGAPKVVLLDLKLPKVDGIEVLRRLKGDERTKDIPVVVLTSSNQERDIQAAYELGANSFVTKPIRFDDFAKAVADLGIYWIMVNVAPG